MNIYDKILQGAYDHVHAALNVISRKSTDLQLANLYTASGMVGNISDDPYHRCRKCHHKQ
jgi:hypothetical protein